MKIQSRPTEEAYSEFQRAYDHYNRALFGDALPPCLITLHRESARVYGYFSHRRFVRLADGRTATDEIAMNPMHFSSRSVEGVLSTLAHEMVHLWQAHRGKPGRRGYHNKQWALKMVGIGLQPSDTAAPGGRETGEKVSHYIVDGGPFSRATAQLLAKGFVITWADAAAVAAGKAKTKGKNRSNRVKYSCPGCGVNAWGKEGLSLVCGDCEVPMIGEAPDDPG